MGLAASQARLLTITARKADCEFLSMNLSHQKLALSRNMERVSSEYQNSLNATKLVYDYYGSGDSDIALNYGLLMTPSVYNDYYPKFVTDSKNRIILNSAYAQAARAAGIPAEGLDGTPSSYVRNAFIEALGNNGIITNEVATSVQCVAYNNAIGLGSTISASLNTAEITFDEMLQLFDAYSYKSDDQANPPYFGSGDRLEHDKEHMVIVNKDGTYTTTYNTPYNLSISDLLKGEHQYIIGGAVRDGGSPMQLDDNDALLLVNRGAELLEWLSNEFETVLGSYGQNMTAIEYAYNEVYDLLYPSGPTHVNYEQVSTNWNDNESDGNKSFSPHKAKRCKDILGIGYNVCHAKDSWDNTSNNRASIGLSLTNIAQAFLTSFVSYLEGVGETKYYYQKGWMNNCNMYDPKKNDMTFTIVTEEVIDDSSDSQLLANFYDTLFNSICVNGWVENAQIDDQEYMGEMLKSGMAFISTISDDGFYYQGNYSIDKNILEVSDTEAISKAQAKYNTEKARLESKEQTIDLKMKNLDTEITSLTTEYDTVKGLISKTIEKSLKRYEA